MPRKENNKPPVGWNSADVAPKAMYDLRGSHVLRSKPVWLLQGAYKYHHCEKHYASLDDCKCKNAFKTSPPKMILGYCVWPRVRFFGKYKPGHLEGKTGEFEQWIPTKEHYFVSLEFGAESLFPADSWKEVEAPPMPDNIPVDDGFRWGTRSCGSGLGCFSEVGESSKWMKDLRRAYVGQGFEARARTPMRPKRVR